MDGLPSLNHLSCIPNITRVILHHDCIYTGSSPVEYNNLEHGIHTVRVKSQKCGENDKRLSFKITV